ncbi:cdc42 effector protein 2 [Latimeria chalumnae]|uniref:CDC42 effector protein 2 n=1 Tax=Latimeria chalumnae TaxID=7897 RepID=H3AQR9_LATCH|nr:PREDICTED: cdc42 effector protein 2 [Latimeria chalumnae]XP_006002514.1 PREDICTED: cdc42 effector protein 2 [Latimeria chalumnae]XP_006002515.1 PREDICTED: cdc42 effector protein 2 [Latimeria chalumnae]|eukprot:XP_006002513.1 PREDICTED: cdc42 effector protein 2 [Latimeria chalumnae]
MSTKAPIYLKRGSRKGKKEKLRDILSSDMISPPLGDFRHTIHIGSGGENDMFGDISFLQGKFHLLPGTQTGTLSQRSSHYGMPFEFARTATISGHQPPSEDSSPLLKNAISLPVIGGPQALMLPTAQAPPKPPRLHLEDKTAQPTPLATSLENGGDAEKKGSTKMSDEVGLCPPAIFPFQNGSQDPKGKENLATPPNGLSLEKSSEEPFLSHAGSLLSLHLDLGPSILDDVLQIMDKHQVDSLSGTMHDSNSTRREILT